MRLTESVREGRPTFATAPRADDFSALEANIAVCGLLPGGARLVRVVGFDAGDDLDDVDVQNRTSLVAAGLTSNLMGAQAREGQIGREARG